MRVKKTTVSSVEGGFINDSSGKATRSLRKRMGIKSPKNPPLFDGGEAIGSELAPFNTPRWEEPVMGPDGQHPQGYTPGELINQGSLMRNPGTDPAPDGKQEKHSTFEPTKQDAALVDADFHNRGRDDFAKGNSKEKTGDLAKWSGVIPGGGV